MDVPESILADYAVALRTMARSPNAQTVATFLAELYAVLRAIS
jgi:hypothetical protein